MPYMDWTLDISAWPLRYSGQGQVDKHWREGNFFPFETCLPESLFAFRRWRSLGECLILINCKCCRYPLPVEFSKRFAWCFSSNFSAALLFYLFGVFKK